MKRREFIIKSVAAGLLVNTIPLISCTRTEKKLKILVLGGTNFLGPSIVNAALGNDHSITLFNRGVTNPSLFSELTLIKGDREQGIGSYAPLQNEKWDVVIDVWPEMSYLVDEATSALKSHTDHYIFISSIAVYNNFQEVGLNEESEVVDLSLSKDEWGYSEEKLQAELFVKDRFPQNHTIIRPGPIKGWRDSALDLLYWCIKLNRDNAIIAPGSGNDPLQFIDVNDIGRFTVMSADKGYQGIYNCVGPTKEPLLWKDFLEYSRGHFNSQSELVWADEDFLATNNVYSFSDLPLWAPLSEDKGFMQISNDKLIQTGFEYSPISATLDDCLKWYNDHMKGDLKFGTAEVGVGLERSKELELIQKLGR